MRDGPGRDPAARASAEDNAGGLREGFSLIHDDDLLRVTHAEGSAPGHVVSFTGIGHGLQGIQTEEFRRSLDEAVPASATYVIDKQRSWFNATRDAVVATVAPIAARHPRTVTLGNSMGGFGALYFASALPGTTRAIAFAPQFAVAPRLMPPEEDRWRAHRAAIGEHVVGHAFEHASPDIDYFAFFGGSEPRDVKHARRMARFATARTHIILVEESLHAVAADLKRTGCLSPLIARMLSPEPLDPIELIRICRRNGVAARRILAHAARKAG